MVRPKGALAAGEVVIQSLHRHWTVMLWPMFWALVSGCFLLLLVVVLPASVPAYVFLMIVSLLLFLPLVLWPFLVWRSTHFVFTNERLMLMSGVIRHSRQDIILAQVNDVKYNQGLLDRFFRCGTLTLQFSDKKNPSKLTKIPDIGRVHGQVVHQVVEAERKRLQDRDEKLRDALAELLRKQTGATDEPVAETPA